MKASLQLKIGQSLTMTPQLQQAIRLLQLSSMELQVEIQEALESNMMLETAEEASAENNDIEKPDGNNLEESSPGENQPDTAQETASSVELENIPDELAVDSVWEDTYESSINEPSTNTSQNYDSSQFSFENQNTHDETLGEHLLWQLNLTPISDTDQAIATTIIDALDDDGYLIPDLTELHSSLNRESDGENTADEESEIGLDEIEAVLHMIQAMEPTGIAARDLQECLLLQLRQCDNDTPMLTLAVELVSKYLDLLASRDFNQLMRRLKLDQEELQDVIALIQSMNPRPGGQIHEARTEYIVPDVYVRKVKGRWRVELNSELMPHLRVNTSYASMIRRADNSEDNVSLKSHLQEARWFIKSLQSRSETLLRVATCIVERQRAFLEYGEEAMKPMVLHDVSEALGMHESTISRVTTRKYMHTPRGIFELKYFFSSHLSTSHGGVASSTAIRALIKKLVAAETPPKPLSDSKISALLSEQGINVARRTVAKYREAMAIPPSNERKRLA
ncbi:MAG: RNA polymerase factor sigma-54 [Gammaproteobacteria bacterium]|nr:MAG: RNA polymerase factor sigma-54 [Gammaproteobacteria bacterium]